MAGRYATALFDLARESGEIDRIAGELKGFELLMKESADLTRFVRSPVFSAEDQARALKALLAKAGVGGLTANFLGLIARNRRLFAVGDMIRAFRILVARHKGEVEADVTSAAALSDAQVTALKAALKASLGKDVQMNSKVDPAILGGLIVKVGSRMIDSSLRTKLNSLKTRMKEVQ
ncbi:MAG: F0F1 ATP synthase subunit delta [Hyphomicrobiaceae bacterium]|nr:MAG: F0F1 ATP synthase subunit delta [Hyphomicrobiaceae bacterium]